jgi:hypothetical protein
LLFLPDSNPSRLPGIYHAEYPLTLRCARISPASCPPRLSQPPPQASLFELWNLGLLHESLEAVIWDNPKFHQFFTPTEIGEAYRRLEELGYFKKNTHP